MEEAVKTAEADPLVRSVGLGGFPDQDGRGTLDAAIMDHEFAHRARERCDSLGLRVINYATGADFLTGSNGDLAAEVKRLHREVDNAEALGAPLMRHEVIQGPRPTQYTGTASFDFVLPRLTEGTRRVTEYAEAKGIRTRSENYGLFVQDPDRVEPLVNVVAHPNY